NPTPPRSWLPPPRPQPTTTTQRARATAGQGSSPPGRRTTAAPATTNPRVPTTGAAPASYTAVNSNPALSTPATLSSALQVSDVDDQFLQLAKVTITDFVAGDVLSANVAGTSITASYANGVLTLTRTDTLANYTQVLDSVTYSSTSTNPTNFGTDTSRTISWV